MPDPDRAEACLPDEEPLIDLETLSEATRLLVVTVPPENGEAV